MLVVEIHPLHRLQSSPVTMTSCILDSNYLINEQSVVSGPSGASSASGSDAASQLKPTMALVLINMQQLIGAMSSGFMQIIPQSDSQG